MNFLDILRAPRIKAENELLKQKVMELEQKLSVLGFKEYSETNAAVETMQKEIGDNNAIVSQQREQLEKLRSENEKADKQLNSQNRKIDRAKDLFNSIDYSIKKFHTTATNANNYPLPDISADLEEFSPNIILKLHCMDVKDLKKAYRENSRQIDKLLELYASRYTTKANKAIYQLMVIALKAELQNILYNLRYEKLEQAENDVKTVTAKYLKIAGDGNQSIVGTLTKFIGEVEYLFINAVKIEYNYYVKKEQARQEQLALKEQMRQEAAERKALADERRKIEKEEEKYRLEIDRITEQMKFAADTEIDKLKAQILSLQSSLSDVAVKKDEITSLQNGKAGNVYIISNLGSFGENVFKIGMTRRLNPQDRVDELGSASVPFKFDVHSFIFSDDAVSLESKLHTELNAKRVNKVNLRKEFFRTSLDELEGLITKLDPTAEFNQTMIAEEYRQSQSTDQVYSSDFVPQGRDGDDEIE